MMVLIIRHQLQAPLPWRPPPSPRMDLSQGGGNEPVAVCGFVYEAAPGLPEDGITAGTAWQDFTVEWKCPDCAVAKADFEMVLMA